jgi:hypothetical protein
MKKILFIIFISSSIIFANDTTATKVFLKDTVYTKSIEKNKNVWVELIPYIIAGLGILSTIATVFITNKNQKKIADEQRINQKLVAQAEINVATKRKHIDDLTNSFIKLDSTVYKIFLLLKKYGYAKNDKNKNLINSLLIEKNNLFSEFKLNLRTFWLYLPVNIEGYKGIKELSIKLEKDFDDYVEECFVEFKADISEKLQSTTSAIFKDIKLAIEAENKILDDIINKSKS